MGQYKVTGRELPSFIRYEVEGENASRQSVVGGKFGHRQPAMVFAQNLPAYRVWGVDHHGNRWLVAIK